MSEKFAGSLSRRGFMIQSAVIAGAAYLGSSAASSDVFAAPHPEGATAKPTFPRFAYIGSRTTRERNARGVGISVYEHDGTAGYTLIQKLDDVVNPSFLTFDPTQRFLYCVHGDQKEVSAFVVNPADGTLALINTVSCNGVNPVHLSVDPQGGYLAVANYATGSFSVLTNNKDGSLQKPVAALQRLPGEPGPHKVEQSASHPHMIPFDPSKNFLVIPDKGLDRVFVYRVVNEGGKMLTTPVSVVKTREGAGPRHIVFSTQGNAAYVVNELDSTVTAYQYQTAKGTLTPFQVIPTTPQDFVFNNRAAAIAIAPDGRFLYASNRGHDSIAVFSIHAKTGRLTAIAHIPSGGKKPRFMTLTPEGKHLFVANEDTDNIVIFDVKTQTGELKASSLNIATGSPVCTIFRST